MEFVSTIPNTFKDSEFFKVIVYSNSKEKSFQKGSWFSKTKELWRGYFVSPFKKTKLVVSVNWSGSNINSINSTISSECVLIFIDSINEWETIKSEFKNLYSKVPSKIVVHKESEVAKSIAQEIKGSFYCGDDAEELRKMIDQCDKKEYEKLSSYFIKFDSDKSGYIEISELPSLALALDEDPKSESFQNSMLVFDVNKDNKISLDEFIVFWKIGRQNTQTLSKIYEFQQYLKENILKMINYENFLKEIKVLKSKNELKTNKIILNCQTKENVKIRTRIEFKLAVGEVKRLEAVRNFISKFTNNLDPIHENWVNFSVFLKSETIDSEIAKKYLQEFRVNLLKHAENNLIPGLSGFINNFLNFKSYNRECSATVLFRLKFDVESILKEACQSFVNIIDSICEKEKGFELLFKLYSEELIEEIFKKDQCLGDLLKNCEINIESSSVKSLLKTLFLNLNKKHQSLSGLLQFFFAPNNLNVDFVGPLTELLDESSLTILNLKLSPFAKFIDFIKSNLNPILLKSMKRLDIGFNLFGSFFNMQIFSDTLWNSEKIETTTTILNENSTTKTPNEKNFPTNEKVEIK